MGILRGNSRDAMAWACAVLVVPVAALAEPSGAPTPTPSVASPSTAPPAQPACNPSVPASLNVHQSVFDRRALLLLKVTIDETGLVHNPAIFRSSGFPDFDKAVLACADGQHQEPPVINGQPTSADAVVGYFLDSPTHPFSIALTTGGIAICDVRKYPRSEMRLWHQGVATLSYRVAVDGSTKDITVLDSTGHPVLDDLSKDCIAAWRFFPFTKEGQPAEIQRVNRIYWILSMSPPPPGSAK